MKTIDSRGVVLAPNTPEYFTSSEPDEHPWGQPSSSHYVLSIGKSGLVGELITKGAYVWIEPLEAIIADWELDAELSAWECLSDEALRSFESQLE